MAWGLRLRLQGLWVLEGFGCRGSNTREREVGALLSPTQVSYYQVGVPDIPYALNPKPGCPVVPLSCFFLAGGSGSH